jgi:hypothetical protein
MIAQSKLSPIHPRGALSRLLLERLAVAPSPASAALAQQALAVLERSRVPAEDRELSLWLLYELHYRGLSGVDDRWEWQPALLAVAARLEADLERDLREMVQPRLSPPVLAFEGVPSRLARLVAEDDGPALSHYLFRRATRAQYAEFLIHRSLYHLKEADPHTWAVPRLAGAAKVALVEIQSDEYGGGRPEWMHATLFAASMRGLSLDDRYAAYINEVPAVTLRWANTMTLFGLHRRLRGAIVGHLAALEMTSSLPNRRYGNGLRRLGFDATTTCFFDEHVEADAVHEQIAAHDLAGRLAEAEPDLVDDILFGAAAAMATDAAVAAHLMNCWDRNETSLRPFVAEQAIPSAPHPQLRMHPV